MYALLLATAIITNYPDGTLLFIEGGNRIVEQETDSPYTHVAMIFNIDGEPWVYEAEPPVVRKVKLSEYIREIEHLNSKKKRQRKLWIMKPKIHYTKAEALKMRTYLEIQIGREYSVLSYILGEVCKGIHCGEITTRALMRAKIILSGNPCQQYPAGILNKSKRYYLPKERISHFIKDDSKLLSKRRRMRIMNTTI